MPINVHAIQALTEGPKPLMDLRREAGSPPATTMRGHLRTLATKGIVERRSQTGFPGALDYELTDTGRDLLQVIDALRIWLEDAPGRPIEPGSVAAKGAIKALVEGWSTSMVRALAAKPLALTELDRLISGINYPSLERRLGAMRAAGQIEAVPGRGRGTPYMVTPWLRKAVAPLAVAARWERQHLAEEAAQIGRIDGEAAFLLAIPLLSLTEDVSGTCRLAIEVGNGDRLAGVLVKVENGRIVSCATNFQGEASAWATGSVSAWLRAVIDHDADGLELGGDGQFARALLDGLNSSLFDARQAQPG